MMKVPFVDLQSQYKAIRSDVLKGVEAVFDKCNFILGEEVQKFEQEFARYIGTKFGIGVANGTDSLHLALRAAGVTEGDEVIVPANTFIATALGATYTGARIVLVDADPKTFLMDVKQLEKAITKKTKAIVPVHLYGRMMDLDPVVELAKKHNLVIVEDTAQAHGAQLRGKKAGSIGAFGSFSFYPGKNLGAYGDGGGLTTNDAELKAKIEAFRNYGSPKKYHHPVVGWNSRLDTVQAAVLSAKLPHLDTYNSKRYDAAVKYNRLLEGVGDLVLPQIPEKGSHVFHLYVVRTKRREELMNHLNSNGVSAVIHYPVPIHLHGAYSNLGYKAGDFPVAEQMCNEIVSLPMFPELTDEQIGYVAEQVKRFF